ncbi:N-acetylmuramoyl-L-alanine amidase, partial [Xanthomonas perforans]
RRGGACGPRPGADPRGRWGGAAPCGRRRRGPRRVAPPPIAPAATGRPARAP